MPLPLLPVLREEEEEEEGGRRRTKGGEKKKTEEEKEKETRFPPKWETEKEIGDNSTTKYR